MEEEKKRQGCMVCGQELDCLTSATAVTVLTVEKKNRGI